MSGGLRPVTSQSLWDELDERLQKMWAGNTDPWRGPVDPQAEARALAQFKRAARREPQDTCGCWSRDCAECGARLADGERPVKGARRRAALAHDAAMLAAKVRAHVAGVA